MLQVGCARRGGRGLRLSRPTSYGYAATREVRLCNRPHYNDALATVSFVIHRKQIDAPSDDNGFTSLGANQNLISIGRNGRIPSS